MIRIAGTRPNSSAPVVNWKNRFTIPWCTRAPAQDDELKKEAPKATVPNAGLKVQYEKKLLALVDEMSRSVQRWVMAAYRANEPHAMDADPADEMQRVMDELKKQWGRKFDEGAERLAAYFAKSASRRTDVQLKEILRKAGFSVQFKMTRAQRDVAKAVVNENVSLIKSIPEQYLKNVEGMVMRSVQTGRDVYGLQKDLQEQLGVSKRRAEFIARDQNNKATAAFNRVRQLDAGIEEAIWQHSSAGKTPRPSHVKAGRDKVRYKVVEGWLDPATGRRIWPGTEPNCGCTSRSVIPGFI